MPATKTQRARRRVPKLEAQIEGLKADLDEANGHMDELASRLAGRDRMLGSQGQIILSLRKDVALVTRQGLQVKNLFSRLAQRYAGVKLETQSFTLDEANAWFRNELTSLETGLTEIAHQVEAEYAARLQSTAANGEGGVDETYAEYRAELARGEARG